MDLNDPEFRTAREEDADGIVQAIRSGFDPELLRMMIYGCEGMPGYVRQQIRARCMGGDTAYTVAVAGGEVVGAVELRCLPGDLFLNYISFLPEARSKGQGKRLLKAALQAARREAHRSLYLDVLEQNRVAREWYRGMGFRYEHATDWHTCPLPPPGDSEGGYIADYPQSCATHEAYGFSTFRLLTPEGSYTVGRLGEEWFRITQPEALRDGAALSSLSRLDGRRQVLALLREGDSSLPEGVGAEIAAKTHRMSVNLNELMNRLS